VTAPVYSSFDLVKRLVAYDTTSRGSNLELIEFVQDYLKTYGVESELTFDPGGKKANLYATVGSQEQGGVMLSGHTDVVPVDGQDWKTDPFAVVEQGDKLYGRGTADMKSFLAVALAILPEIKARKLKMPVHYAMSFDEEVGCQGVRHLITALAKKPVKPRLCIIGEPTLMKPVSAHKGKVSWRCEVHGHESHSALAHQGANAVEAAAEMIAFLKAAARQKRDKGPFDPRFTPPYSTIHTGTINGGTALNIVPKDCSFVFECRHVPGDDPYAVYNNLMTYANSQILPEMRAVSAATGIDVEVMTAVPGLGADPNGEAMQMVLALTGANEAGTVAFGTEGGLFQEAGIPTMVCGPGSIEQAHKPDEFIAAEQIVQCEGFLRRLLDRLSA